MLVPLADASTPWGWLGGVTSTPPQGSAAPAVTPAPLTVEVPAPSA
ncbi:MAG: hypothetical protein QM767_04525 [Anaeromyxobacter sp.]